MVDIKSQWNRVTDKGKWGARGASLVAKAKATKVVWFPPKPVDAGKEAASTANKATKGAAKKTAGATKKTAGATKKTAGATKKATGATKKADNGPQD